EVRPARFASAERGLEHFGYNVFEFLVLMTARILTSRMSLSGRSRVVFISPYSQKTAFLSIWHSFPLQSENRAALSASTSQCYFDGCRFSWNRTTNRVATKARLLQSC